MANDRPDHDREHQRIAEPPTARARALALEAHLRADHSDKPLADRLVPIEQVAESQAALHNALHHDATPAERISIVRSVGEDLHDALEWLRELDAEAAEQCAIAEVGALLGAIEDPRTAEADRLVRAWRELTDLGNQILSGDAGARPELEG